MSLIFFKKYIIIWRSSSRLWPGSLARRAEPSRANFLGLPEERAKLSRAWLVTWPSHNEPSQARLVSTPSGNKNDPAYPGRGWLFWVEGHFHCTCFLWLWFQPFQFLFFLFWITVLTTWFDVIWLCPVQSAFLLLSYTSSVLQGHFQCPIYQRSFRTLFKSSLIL